jgi:hypothetical protein
LSRAYHKLYQRRFRFRGVTKPASLSSYEDKIVYRINVLLARVKEMLDMYPPEMYFTIRIFKSSDEIDKEYYKIMRERKSVKAFYNHRFKTIYTSEGTISDSVIAHELTHVIIDNYFLIRPPAKVAEMMAIHTDSHLD